MSGLFKFNLRGRSAGRVFAWPQTRLLFGFVSSVRHLTRGQQQNRNMGSLERPSSADRNTTPVQKLSFWETNWTDALKSSVCFPTSVYEYFSRLNRCSMYVKNRRQQLLLTFKGLDVDFLVLIWLRDQVNYIYSTCARCKAVVFFIKWNKKGHFCVCSWQHVITAS